MLTKYTEERLHSPQLISAEVSDSGEAVPLAVFPEDCAFRAAAEHHLIEAGVEHRIALVSASRQVIHAAVVDGLCVTVMAKGTVPVNLSVLKVAELPSLPSTCIQIVEREQGVSPAMRGVATILRKGWQS